MKRTNKEIITETNEDLDTYYLQVNPCKSTVLRNKTFIYKKKQISCIQKATRIMTLPKLRLGNMLNVHNFLDDSISITLLPGIEQGLTYNILQKIQTESLIPHFEMMSIKLTP